ncbi:MAG: hypothetical protein KDD03_13215 [Gelidibacter sp.]|nr:hypothetical protein [Gelidibacter sp.]
MIYYKVVKNDLTSAWDWFNAPEYNIQYKLNTWVEPKIKEAPLMVFRDLKDAELFIYNNALYSPDYKLYKCEIKKSRKKWKWTHPGDLDTVLKAKRAKKKLPSAYTSFLPNGTVLADKVKLLEEVA